MQVLEIIIAIVGGVCVIVSVLSPLFCIHEISTPYDKYNEASVERRGMKKHYFKFNYLEKPHSLSDYNFKCFDTDYAWYIYETLYNSRKNQTLNICVKRSTKVIAWLEWNEWGEYKTKRLSFKKLKKYIKKNLPNLLKDRIFIEVAETKYGDTYTID